VETGKQVVVLEGFSHGVAFSPDGRRLACGVGNAIKVWDVALGWASLSLTGHLASVRAVTFSPDGRRIVSGSDDNTLKVWDAERGQELLTLNGHTGAVRCTAFSPDGRRIISGSENGTLKFWDAVASDWTLTPETSKGCWALAFGPDGRQIVGGGGNGRLRVWDVATGQDALDGDEKAQGVGNAERLRTMHSLAFSPDGERIVSGHGGGRLWVWDANKFQRLFALGGHSLWVNDAAYSPDGRRIASASRDETIKLWDAATGKEILTIHAEAGPIFGLAFSPDGRRIVSGAFKEPHALQVWDAATGQAIRSLEGHTGAVIGVAYSPDGELIASSGNDKAVRIWNAASGEQLHQFQPPDAGELDVHPDSSGLSNLAFSPDGRWIVCGLYGTMYAQAWEVDSGRPLFALKPRDAPRFGHFNNRVVFSPDGKWIATAVSLDSIKLWDVSRLPGAR
jgi:WD40 repeat protein